MVLTPTCAFRVPHRGSQAGEAFPANLSHIRGSPIPEADRVTPPRRAIAGLLFPSLSHHQHLPLKTERTLLDHPLDHHPHLLVHIGAATACLLYTSPSPRD